MNEEKKIGLKELLEQFKEEGVNPQLKVKAFEKDYKDSKEKKVPIFIQILMFIGALLAAVFFLIFLGLGGLFDSEGVLMVLGFFVIGGGLAIPYVSKQKTSIEPLGLAALIVGCSLFTAGLITMLDGRFIAFLMVSLVLSIVVLIVAGSHLQKVSAIFCANLCLFCLIYDFKLYIGFNFLILANAAVITAFWLKEPDILAGQSKLGQWYAAILNGCSFSMLAILCFSVNERMSRYSYRSYYQEDYASYWWISSILLVALVLWTLKETLDLIKVEKQKVPIIVGAGLALMILIKAPGIIAGILLLFLGLFSGYRFFAGQGILAIFCFTVMFYYNMETSLLFKSILMTGSGIIFLAIGTALRRMHERERDTA